MSRRRIPRDEVARIPCDRAAELGYLAAVLAERDPDAARSALTLVAEEDFAAAGTREVLGAMRTVAARGPLDPGAVLAALGDDPARAVGREALTWPTIRAPIVDRIAALRVPRVKRRLAEAGEALARRAANGATPQDLLAALDSLAAEGRALIGAGAEPLPALDLGDLDAALAPPPWRARGFFAREDRVIIASEPAEGKSWLALDLALSAALGLPWGCSVPLDDAPCSVVYLDMENAPALIARRLRLLATGRNVTVGEAAERLHMASTPDLDVLRADDWGRLVRTAEKHAKGGLVVLDTLRRLHVGAEKDDEHAAALIRRITELAARTAGAVIVLHHLRKGDGSLRERIRGSGDLLAGFDVALVLDRTADGRRLSCVKSRWGSEPAPLALDILDTDDCRGVTVSLGEMPSTRRSSLLDALDDAGPLGATSGALYDGLAPGERRARQRDLARLTRERRVVTRREGRTIHYWARAHAPQDLDG